jgi:hypothetical protein
MRVRSAVSITFVASSMLAWDMASLNIALGNVEGLYSQQIRSAELDVMSGKDLMNVQGNTHVISGKKAEDPRGSSAVNVKIE